MAGGNGHEGEDPFFRWLDRLIREEAEVTRNLMASMHRDNLEVQGTFAELMRGFQEQSERFHNDFVQLSRDNKTTYERWRAEDAKRVAEMRAEEAKREDRRRADEAERFRALIERLLPRPGIS